MDALSAKTGKEVSKQTISKYEAGKTMAGSSILIKLSRALDVPVDYFSNHILSMFQKLKSHSEKSMCRSKRSDIVKT